MRTRGLVVNVAQDGYGELTHLGVRIEVKVAGFKQHKLDPLSANNAGLKV
jgi:hypothetical protein